MVLLLFRHRALQLENIGQIGRAQVVRKYPASGVGIADVHMPIDESGRNHHLPGVNHPVGGNVRQLRRLADPDDSLPLNQD